eukprot:TRINITY_DN2516_c0_g1_i1.p1 TRINITY_DN2516_c0_g1~~TRINITY_DN2516_c0_g1_i1.p1  ORF type:complete len:251 (+),score=65.43 TRINITY_DN2516_c0_g1_i1:26-754(+)
MSPTNAVASLSSGATDALTRMSPTHAVAIVASIATVALFTSPLNVAWEMNLRKSTGSYSPLPYFAMILNCVVWALYGSRITDAAIFFPNTVGICVATLTLTAFSRNLETEKRRSFTWMAVGAVVVAGALATWFFFLLSPQDATPCMGAAGAALSISMFASPFATMQQVIAEKNSASLPLPMILASAVNCALWTTYGALIGNLNVLIPNAAGLCFSVVQLGLVAAYPREPASGYQPIPESDYP